jgi:DNA-binding response OmpR family regulator
VVEDARDIARLLDMHLHDEGYEVEVAFDGLQGWEKLQEVRYDLVILDLMLPGVDGLELCRRLRAQQGADGAYTPVLMLTSKGTELDRVLGLELGADDYLTKPFFIRELVARVKALFRRAEAMKSAGGASGKIAEDCPSAEGGSGRRKNLHRQTVHRNRSSARLRSIASWFLLLQKNLTCCISSPVIRGEFTRAHNCLTESGAWDTKVTNTPSTHTSTGCAPKLKKTRLIRITCSPVWGVGYKFCDSEK